MFDYYGNAKIVLPIMLLIMVMLAVIIGVKFRAKDNRLKNIPLAIITIILLILEIIKQIYALCDGSYCYYTLPLHFCSLFIYFSPLATFFKGKIQRFGKTMAYVTSVFLLAVFYFNPLAIIGRASDNLLYDFYSFHTFIYHHLAILFALTVIALRFYNFDKYSFLHVVIGISVYAIIALTVAYSTNTNYCNILTSNIQFMENIRTCFGQVAYTLILYLIGLLGGFVICGVNIIFNKSFRK